MLVDQVGVADRSAAPERRDVRAIPSAPVERLRERFRGELILPAEPAYEVHRRVWNGSIDRHPAVIARCAGVADVIDAVRLARELDLPIAVRGGGHSFPGLSVCDDGMVVDLRPMAGVAVDPTARIVRAQAGLLLGELDHETEPFGLAVPAGFISHTGLAGLALGGGIGWLHRKHGLTVDQLESADVVTAEGEFLRVSEDEHADLFWGLRGGGGNFGIVTEFRFHAHPVGPQVMAGPVLWRLDDAPRLLRFYRDWIRSAPDELMTIVILRQAPDLPGFPAELVGRPVAVVAACYAGPIEAGEAALRPLKRFGAPVLDWCEPKTFVAHQRTFDASFQAGNWYYVRSCDVAELTDDVIDISVEYASRISSPITSVGMWQMGGAVARVGEEDTAFNGRAAGHTFNINGNSLGPDGFEEQRDWARSIWSALAPYHTSVYVNFLMEEGEERIRQAYGATKYERLKALKRAYDPDNVFRFNQNIRPD
jgi:FAD/FMN-containing dehydrogenase